MHSRPTRGDYAGMQSHITSLAHLNVSRTDKNTDQDTNELAKFRKICSQAHRAVLPVKTRVKEER